jgi:hypothetical protein
VRPLTRPARLSVPLSRRRFAKPQSKYKLCDSSKVGIESVQSCGLGSSLGWTIKLVFEAVPGSSVERKLGTIERAEKISPATWD